ncbi:uncharacterized protein LOC142587584 isoform X12 [Dermacentor variabilis]|uniref:uncharacterized protein LOC142587584 isoform X12 n=1 Tax=Dermacentor variabilis TaxID=34621 RepID=UPI003F5B4457
MALDNLSYSDKVIFYERTNMDIQHFWAHPIKVFSGRGGHNGKNVRKLHTIVLQSRLQVIITVSRSLQGIFDERRKKHMDVKTSGPLFNFQEDLVFMSDDYSCAVVMTTTNVCGKVIRYDLRIRNAFIKKPPQKNCLKWFHKYEKHGTVRYDPSCQHILAHHGESKPYDEEQERCKATKLGIGLATLSNALAAKILRRAQKCCFDVPASAVSPRPCKTYHLDRATASNI